MMKVIQMKKFQIKHKKSLSKANLVIIAIALVAIAFLSVGYAYLSQQLNIGGSITKLAYAEIHFDSIGDMTSTGNGYSYYNPTKTANSITTHVDLPALNSSVTYTVTLKNDSSVTKQLDAILVSSNSNNDIVYSLDGIALQDTFIAGSTTTFTITLSYKNDLTTLPENTVQSLLLTFDFVEYVPIQMAYASGNMILKLDGLDTPVNDNWYDEDNNKTMTLTNVPHNNVQHYYDFSGSGFGTMGTALIPETGDFTLEALVARPLKLQE